MTDLAIRGIGFWSPGVVDWPQARDLVRSGAAWPAAAGGRAIPALMPANERRRAPEGVLLALTAAEQACADAGIDPRMLPSVFVSAYGDLAINDYMCAALAEPAPMLSPTKFHNSVHNAPSGYWSIVTGSMAPATALAGFRDSFAAGLLETASQAIESGGPVMLVAYDIAAAGPLAGVIDCTLPFACALVLDAAADAAGQPGTWRLRLAPGTGNAAASLPRTPALAALAEANPIANASGALLEALALGRSASLVLTLSPGLHLAVDVLP